MVCVNNKHTHKERGLREGGRQAGRRLQRTRRKKQCSKYSKCCSTRNVVKINGWWWVVGGGWQVVATWQRDNDCDDDCADLRTCVHACRVQPAHLGKISWVFLHYFFLLWPWAGHSWDGFELCVTVCEEEARSRLTHSQSQIHIHISTGLCQLSR